MEDKYHPIHNDDELHDIDTPFGTYTAHLFNIACIYATYFKDSVAHTKSSKIVELIKIKMYNDEDFIELKKELANC